jgi:hypothetical protein
MKKTKTILALVSALALLLVAACDTGLDPTAPDLGNYHDSKNNQSYEGNEIKTDKYFPDIDAANGTLNGGRTTPANKDSLVKIDFTTAVGNAKAAGRTLDILKGDVAANIKAAITFQGVTYPSTASGSNFKNYSAGLDYTVKDIDQNIVYVDLAGLESYHRVRPYIKASAYTINGIAIDTNANRIGGEDPYDDEYYTEISIADGLSTDSVNSSADSDTPIVYFTLSSFITDNGNWTAPNPAFAYIYATYSNSYSLDPLGGAGIDSYITLEEWSPAEKTWKPSTVKGVNGYYIASVPPFPTAEGYYYFKVPYSATTSTNYRVVANKLYDFTTGTVPGYDYKLRFENYPGSTTKITGTDGKKVLCSVTVYGNAYTKTHTPSGTIFSEANLYADEGNKNAVLVFDVIRTAGELLGDLGLKKPSSDGVYAIGEFNANFKLAYEILGSGDAVVWEYVPINKAVVRDKPGALKDALGRVDQQLVLTLDPNYAWPTDGRDVTIFARSGIKFAGDAGATPVKGEGSLGNENGSYKDGSIVVIDGNYDWGAYGTVTALEAREDPASVEGSDVTVTPPGVEIIEPPDSDETPPLQPELPSPPVDVISAPTGVYAYLSSGIVYLSWDDVEGATYYYVYRNGSYVGSATSPGYSDTDLSAGTYSYRVRAYSVGGEESPLSTQSNTVTIEGGDFPPSDPTPLENGEWTWGEIQGYNDVNWYSFEATPGETYFIGWQDSEDHNGDSYTCDIKVSAYTSEETSLFSEVDAGYTNQRQISEQSGTIYLKVQGYYSSYTGTYQIGYSSGGGGGGLSFGWNDITSWVTANLPQTADDLVVAISSGQADDLSEFYDWDYKLRVNDEELSSSEGSHWIDSGSKVELWNPER